MASYISKYLDQKMVPLPSKFSEWIPVESLTLVHPLVKNLCTKKILQLSGRLTHFSKNWEKLTQGPETLFVVKGHMLLFFKIPVQRAIAKQVTLSKIQELLTD